MVSAALLLDHLHQDDLAALDHLLDLVLAAVVAGPLGDLGQRVAVAADLGDLGLGVGIVGILVRIVILVGLVLVVLILVVVGLLVLRILLVGGLVGLVVGDRPGRIRRDGLGRRLGHGQRFRNGDPGLGLDRAVLVGRGVLGLRRDRGGVDGFCGGLGSRLGGELGALRRLGLRLGDIPGRGLGGERLLHRLGVLGERVGHAGRRDPGLRGRLGALRGLTFVTLDLRGLVRGFVRVLGAHRLVGAAGAGLGAATAGAAGRAAAALLALAVLLGVAGLLLEERLPVGEGDLVVVGVDLVEGQEAVAVAAVLDEGRLERRLHPGDLGEIDVAAQLTPVGGFEVELLDPRPVDRDDSGLLRVHRVD